MTQKTQPTPLTPSQIDREIKQIANGWSLNGIGMLEKTYVSKGFLESIALVNAIALLAESSQHHPDLLILWNKVTVKLTTHDAGGISQKDFDLALKIDQLPIIR